MTITKARSVFSPSQLDLAKRCRRAWTIRYVFGVKSEGVGGRGRVLGTMVHKALQIHVAGRAMLTLAIDDFDDRERREFERFREAIADEKLAKLHEAKDREPGDLVEIAKAYADAEFTKLLNKAPQRAITALAYLPTAEACQARYAETQLSVRTEQSHGVKVAFSDMSRMDLVAIALDGSVFLYDYKSTSGKGSNPWEYVPSVEELEHDIQLLVYALCVMQIARVTSLWCRWIYVYTGESCAPQSTYRDVHVTYDQVVERLRPWLALCSELTEAIDVAIRTGKLPDIESIPLPANVHDDDTPCNAYRGCAYRGRECKPPMIPVEALAAKAKAKQEKEKEKPMSVNLHDLMNSAPALPTSTPNAAAPAQITNPPGYNYVPNEFGQLVIAPPGHPAYTLPPPAGYVYPPGRIPAAPPPPPPPPAMFDPPAPAPAPAPTPAPEAATPPPAPEPEPEPKKKRTTRNAAAPAATAQSPSVDVAMPAETVKTATDLVGALNAVREHAAAISCTVNVTFTFGG